MAYKKQVKPDKKALKEEKEAEKKMRKELKKASKEQKKAEAKIRKDAKIREGVKPTVENSIPFESVHKSGVFELEPHLFSKTYKIEDVNYIEASDDTQNAISKLYSELLGSFDTDVQMQISLYNRTTDIYDFQNNVILGMKADGLNNYRAEYNDMLLDKMTGGKNNLETEIYLTLSFHADDIFDAASRANELDKSIEAQVSSITKRNATVLSLEDRLDLLNKIYNQDNAVTVKQSRTINGQKFERFSLEGCIKNRLSVKSVIKPPSIVFEKDHSEFGEYVAKTYYISYYPPQINGDVLRKLSSVPTNMLVSVYFDAMPSDEAMKTLKIHGANINTSIADKQHKASHSGYDPNLISPSLKEAQREVEDLRDDLSTNNSRLFLMSIVITLFASDMASLNGYETQLKSAVNSTFMSISPAYLFQEPAFNTSLPIGFNQLKLQRLATSDTTMALTPFYVREIKQTHGMYYGLNAMSHNMILYDRTSTINPNGCILGMPGTGKSFASKREILNVLLNTDDDVYILDPEGEYGLIAKSMNGTIIKLSPGSGIHINPLDLNLGNEDDSGSAVKTKANFISAICEIAVGGRFGLQAEEQSIIDRCAEKIYEPYIQELRAKGKEYDADLAPTLEDFYKLLRMQPDIEARKLCLSLERYIYGSADLFSHKTNVNINNRFVVYDIKDLIGLKDLGLHICLDNIWNKMIENKKKGKRTWFYIDEFYLLMQKQISADYVAQIWKRARKWNGVPTAITQNVEDLLKSPEARTIINNSSFIMLLGQAPLNREQLSQMLSISPQEQEYLNSAKPGKGLLRIGSDDNFDIIPFDDNFPKNTELYRIMSTKPNEFQ